MNDHYMPVDNLWAWSWVLYDSVEAHSGIKMDLPNSKADWHEPESGEGLEKWALNIDRIDAPGGEA